MSFGSPAQPKDSSRIRPELPSRCTSVHPPCRTGRDGPATEPPQTSIRGSLPATVGCAAAADEDREEAVVVVVATEGAARAGDTKYVARPRPGTQARKATCTSEGSVLGLPNLEATRTIGSVLGMARHARRS